MRGFRFIVLLITLVLLILGLPLANIALPNMHPLLAQIFLGVLLVAMLCSAVLAVSDNRRKAILAAALAAPAVTMQAVDAAIDHEGIMAAASICDIIFLSYVIAVVVRHLFTNIKVTANMICASLCVYLLLGIVWADVYALLDIVEGGSFSYNLADETTHNAASDDGDNQGKSTSSDRHRRLKEPDRMRLHGGWAIYPIYFSFVTMTTLGYGDIVPRTSPARAFVSIQAVMGQLYLAVLVARLVGLHITWSTRDNQGEPPESL